MKIHHIAIGFLIGFGFCLICCILAVFSFIRADDKNTILIERWPPGVSTIKFKNNLVEIGVSNHGFFEDDSLSCVITANGSSQETLTGIAKDGRFLFLYNDSINQSTPTVVNKK